MNDDIPDLPLSDEYFTTQALKSAVWAYLIDHARTSTGIIKIVLAFNDEKDFWRRVSARKYGNYKAQDMYKIVQKAASRDARWRELEIGARKAEQKEKKLIKLRETNPLRFRLIMFLRKTANKLLSPAPMNEI